MNRSVLQTLHWSHTQAGRTLRYLDDLMTSVQRAMAATRWNAAVWLIWVRGAAIPTRHVLEHCCGRGERVHDHAAVRGDLAKHDAVTGHDRVLWAEDVVEAAGFARFLVCLRPQHGALHGRRDLFVHLAFRVASPAETFPWILFRMSLFWFLAVAWHVSFWGVILRNAARIGGMLWLGS